MTVGLNRAVPHSPWNIVASYGLWQVAIPRRNPIPGPLPRLPEVDVVLHDLCSAAVD